MILRVHDYQPIKKHISFKHIQTAVWSCDYIWLQLYSEETILFKPTCTKNEKIKNWYVSIP